MMHLFLLLLCLSGAPLAITTKASVTNFIFVLADDLDFDYKQDRKLVMPTLKKYFSENGLEFRNHAAVYPVCGPSRSSMLVGRYPHNTGYVQNAAKDSVAAFSKLANYTIGRWMTDAGYYTAFLGKYVNGMECDIPSGWNHWGGLTCTKYKGMKLGGTYNYYNASQWQIDFDETATHPITPIKYKIQTGVHQSTFLGKQAVEQMTKAKSVGKPFFIHTTPLMVHGGTCYGPQPSSQYAPTDPFWEHKILDPTLNTKGVPKNIALTGSPCPTTQHAWDFSNLTNPHLPSWGKFQNGTVPANIENVGNPDKHGCCDNWEEVRQHRVYRNRTSAALDLDDFLKIIFKGLEDLNLLDTTYVIFSSDNGYHLGEHRLLFGKSHPYETDTRLPMYIRGPGIPKGEVRIHPTTHLDITATIADLANIPSSSPPFPIDGKSFKEVLTATPPSLNKWRNFSFSEFFVTVNTWRQIRHINATTGKSEFTFHWWCTNQSEVYHLVQDPYQMNNVGGDSPTSYGQKKIDQYLGATEVLGKCVGQSCSQMPAPRKPSPNPLPCGSPQEMMEVEEVWMDF